MFHKMIRFTLVILCTFGLALSGCIDDSGGNNGGTTDVGPDAFQDSGGDDDTGLTDTGDEDAGVTDTGEEDTGVTDTGDEDTGVTDTGDDDTGLTDTGDEDTGLTDTDLTDTGTTDTGTTDTGATETGATDTGTTDTGTTDTGTTDTGTTDAGDASTTCDYTGYTAVSEDAYQAQTDLVYEGLSSTAATTDIFSVQLYGGTTFGGATSTGQYTILDESYADCGNCILIYDDCGSASCSKTFLATSGTMDITSYPAAVGGTFSATLTNMVFEEVTVDSTTFESTKVPNGETWCVNNYSFSEVTQ
jgi:hypothetical protein